MCERSHRRAFRSFGHTNPQSQRNPKPKERERACLVQRDGRDGPLVLGAGAALVADDAGGGAHHVRVYVGIALIVGCYSVLLVGWLIG